MVVELREGDPAGELIACCDARKASLRGVGAGARPEGWFARTFAPSVTTAVARHASCPVLIVRHNRGTGRILVATDLTDPTVPTLRAAAAAAGKSPTQVTVIHCLAPMPAMSLEAEGAAALAGLTAASVLATATAQLDAWVARAGLMGTATARVLHGPPTATILAEAESLCADLIIIGTRGRTGVDRVLSGSVAEQIVQGASGHVLVVRLGEGEVAAAPPA